MQQYNIWMSDGSSCHYLFSWFTSIFSIVTQVLTQEIGENVNMQTLLNETSNWRGRAQQIITLQQKVCVLGHYVCSFVLFFTVYASVCNMFLLLLY